MRQLRIRKKLDAEINLVPFIDLLSMCICFLLMTAVWMELSAIQIKQEAGTESFSKSENSEVLNLNFLSQKQIEIVSTISKNSTRFIISGKTYEELLILLGNYLNKTTRSQINSARVKTKAGVTYGQLVSILDLLRNHGILNLGIVPVRTP